MSGTIDNAFVDVDFDAEADAHGFEMGALPSTEAELMFSPIFEASNPVYPRSELADRIRSNDDAGAWPTRMIKFTHDQGREPSCVYNSLALAQQIALFRATGKSIKFSAISGYRYNGSRTSGSSVGGSVRYSEGTGLLPSDIPDNQWISIHGHVLHPDNGYGINPAPGWKTTARMFRAHEWMRVTTVEGWWSAILSGWACSGGRDGHCIAHTELNMEGNDLTSIYANSWGPWGFSMPTLEGDVKSFGADSERKIRTMVGRDAFAIRTVLVPDFLV